MMARIRFVLPLLVLVVAALLTKGLLSMREKPVVEPPAPQYPLVEVLVAEPTTVQHVVRAHGEVSTLGEIDLVPEVGGRVRTVSPSLKAGAFFRGGDTLLELDPEDLERAVTIARSVVREAELARETEAARARVARDEWESLDLGEATPLARRQPQLDLAEARLAAARARLAQTERDLGRTVIEAPFDGRVVSERVGVGQVIAPGVPIARLTRTDRAEVVLPIHDADLAVLSVPLFPSEDGAFAGPAVTLRARFAGQERSWSGRIRRVEGQLDPRTRMVRLVAEVEDPYRPAVGREVPLPPGLFVEAEIVGKEASGVFVLPRSAWYEGTHLLVVDDESRVSFRAPVIERLERESIVIRSGLSKGERVVVSPLETAVEGMRVEVGSAATAEETALGGEAQR